MWVLKKIGLMVILNIAGSSFSEINLLASRQFCGYQHTDDYNRDSDSIAIDEFPWLAQLLYNENREIACTGSLINNRYILTAAHCINSNYTHLVGVRLGDFNITSDRDCVKHSQFSEECSDPLVEFDIEELIPHPDHNRITSANDIGLIRLSRSVDYSDYIRPICLPSKNWELVDGEELAISGWGLLNDGKQQTELKKKILAKLLSIKECTRAFKEKRKHISDKVLCVLEDEVHTCQGDSGGPLMVSKRNQWEQVGVLSFGDCSRRFPSGYMKVTSYLDWITKNLRP